MRTRTGRRITGLVTAVTLLAGMGVTGVVASAAPAFATDQTPGQGVHIADNTATLSVTVAANSGGIPNPGGGRDIPDPPPRKEPPPVDCGKPTITLVPGKPGRPPKRVETPSTCDPNSSQWLQPGDTYTRYSSGYATWNTKDIIFGIEDLNYSGGLAGVSRPMPSGLPDTNGYVGQCRNDFRPVTAAGFTGWFSPESVGWLRIQTEQADANRQWREIADFAVFGNCTWPSVKMVANTCPLWAKDVYADGPTGLGLPVQSGDGSFVQASVSQRQRAYTRTGASQVFSPIGRAIHNGSFPGLSDAAQAQLIAECLVDISAEFTFKPPYFGNYVLSGPGERATCSFIEFAGMRKVVGCTGKQTFPFQFRSYLACDGRLYGGRLTNYDFSCKKPTGTCIAGGPCPVDTPPATWTEPFEPSTMVRCTFEQPITRTPQGLRVPTMNGVATVAADGRAYRIDWGTMTTEGSPAITRQWTDFLIAQGSSPGNPEEHANDRTQPFTGTVNRRPALMWAGDTSDMNRGITGDWEEAIDLRFYQAGQAGKTFTVWQERSYTWTRTIPSQSWDGSMTPINFPITETCKSVPATFLVVSGRNAGS